ncbi:carboxymuconolactone decarboxylase family protein [Sinorhizobium chiapasense]|uniref:Carboxymuconolactone decarboxylase family protein n=1 Tax=Sinorhizobium chiapasense TaxID=501572 RepID=A0ABZ2BGC2_9HYPH
MLRDLHTIEASGAKTGTLDRKTHDLIALGFPVTTRCDDCIAVHVKKAVELDALHNEIAEALQLLIALNAGAALSLYGVYYLERARHSLVAHCDPCLESGLADILHRLSVHRNTAN